MRHAAWIIAATLASAGVSPGETLDEQVVRLLNEGKLDEAEPLAKRAVDETVREKGQGHLDTVPSLTNLASLYVTQGKYAEAEKLYKQALAIRQKVLGQEHADTATSLYALADLFRIQGNYDEAELLLNRALAIREKALGLEHPGTVTFINGLALLYLAQDKCDEAESLYRRALTIREKALDPEHPDTIKTRVALAGLCKVQGRNDDADALVRTVENAGSVRAPEDLETAAILREFGRLFREQRKYEEAERSYKQAWAIRQQALGCDHPDYAECCIDLAIVAVAQGQHERSKALHDRAKAIYDKAAPQRQIPGLLFDTTMQVLFEEIAKQQDAEKKKEREPAGTHGN